MCLLPETIKRWLFNYAFPQSRTACRKITTAFLSITTILIKGRAILNEKAFLA